MKDVPSLKIELSGHTDNVGGDAANQKLSQRRAEAVRAYLVSRSVMGIELRLWLWGKSSGRY